MGIFDNMRKKIIQLTESELRKVVSESIKNVLKNDSLNIEDYFDISKISKQDIVSINNDMRAFLQGRGFGDSVFCDGENVIAEATNKTVPVLELRKRLMSMGFKRWQVVSTVYANKVRVVILYADVAKNTQTIITQMKSMGWDKVHISLPMDIHGVQCRVMDFDPSEQGEITKEVHKHNYLYHLTPANNVTSIMTTGIEIRSENDYLDYPPRAHVIKGNTNKANVAHFGWQLFHASKQCFNGKYAILRIDTSKIPLSISFYGDPRYPYGYISKETIPPIGFDIFGYITYQDKNRYNGEMIIVTATNDTMPD